MADASQNAPAGGQAGQGVPGANVPLPGARGMDGSLGQENHPPNDQDHNPQPGAGGPPGRQVQFNLPEPSDVADAEDIQAVRRELARAREELLAIRAAGAVNQDPEYRYMVAGPRLADNPTPVEERTPLSTKLYEMYARGAFGANNPTLGAMGGSLDLIYSLQAERTTSGSNDIVDQTFYTRVSIGSAQHRVRMNWVSDDGRCTYPYKFSELTTIDSVANAIGTVATGCREGINAGANITPLGVGQSRVAAYEVAKSYGLDKTRRVSTYKVWVRVWHNVLLCRIAARRIVDGERHHWNRRPNNRHRLFTQEEALNVYTELAQDLKVGRRALVEMDRAEGQCIGELTCYMGGNPDMFRFEAGDDGNGNDVVLHISDKHPEAFPWDILIRDGNRNQIPPNNEDMAIAGLPAGPIVPANTRVTAFNGTRQIEALRIIARAYPIQEEIFGAFLDVGLSIYGESFRGVSDQFNCGDSLEGAGYDALLRRGAVSMSAGDLSTCILTKLTENSTEVSRSRTLVEQLFSMTASWVNHRKAMEPVIFAIQHGMRRCGASIPVLFPRAGWQNLHHNNIAPPANSAQARLDTHARLCLSPGADNGGTIIGNMVDIMVDKMYNCYVPDCFTYLEYGDSGPNRRAPTHGTTNVGECFTSVHAAQLPAGMIDPRMSGYAGVPFNLGAQMYELEFRNRRDGFQALGQARSRLGPNPEGGQTDQFLAETGVGMLGHTIVLSRDAAVDGEGGWRISCAPARAVGETQQNYGVLVRFNRNERFAFGEDDDFANLDDRSATHMDLYADYDWITGNDLSFVLPADGYGSGVADGRNRRRRLPAYAMAKILDAQVAGHGASTLVNVFPPRRRVRTNAGTGNPPT